MIGKDHLFKTWLNKQKYYLTTICMGLLAFLAYACMYGIRKPFTVAEFSGLTILGIDYKTLLVISQVIGYALSKFIGIKVVSEMKSSHRAVTIIFLAAIAEVALVLFNLIPTPYNFIMLFFNGLPLGMIWGLVFSYLEGRKTTELLGTILSISFIVSSGFVKSIGKMLTGCFHLTEFQMPWITGLFFFIPMAIFVWLLNKLPEPTKEDELQRTKRIPMGKALRYKFFLDFAPGLISLIVAYIFLTIFRDLRDNFAAEIWLSIGINKDSMIFTFSELPIATIVLIVMTLVMFIKNNMDALKINHHIILSGFILIGLSTFLVKIGMINSMVWMILLGLGTYLGYLPFNCLLFDRLIAACGSAANAGFFIYLADSFGYLGSVGTLIYKNFAQSNMGWSSFLVNISYTLSITGSIFILISLMYFKGKFSYKSEKKMKLYNV